MRGYCVQCAMDVGLDPHNFLRLSGDQETIVAVECVGCGYNYVDYEGNCVDGGCAKHSEKKETE